MRKGSSVIKDAMPASTRPGSAPVKQRFLKGAKLCFCLLLCVFLCSCAYGGEEDPEKDLIKVTLVDSLLFTADEPAQSVAYGGTVSFTLTMRQGYTVSACSYEDYEVTGQDGVYTLTLRNVTRPSRVTVTASAQAKEPNTNPERTCSIRYVYNDGTDREKTETYTLSYHIRPNTMTGNGIERDGYTLLCWNTSPDGTGQDIGLGSRATVGEDGTLTLYGKWVKWADASDFVTRRQDGTLVLTGYRGDGTDEMLVIPGKINGLTVTVITSSFTTSMSCGTLSSTTLVLPSTIQTVEDNAFLHSAFREIYFFDNLETFGSKAFPNAIATIHINAATAPRLQKENYNVRFADNIDLLIANQDKKKMIFFSGCSMCYGLDSSMVEDAFDGEYVVINAGLNGEFNALFQLECMLPYISEGDILIHAPEQPNPYQFLANKMVDSRVYCMVEGNYDLLALADFSYNAYMIESYTSYAGFRQKTEECTYEDYNVLFNNYGDYVEPRPYDESTEMVRDVSYSELWGYDNELLTEENIAFLASVYDQFRQRGAEVYFAWAPMNECSTAHEDIRAAADSYQERLEELFAPYGIPVISEATDYIYQGRYFYDTDYHLNDLGVAIHTEQLIEDIQEALRQ